MGKSKGEDILSIFNTDITDFIIDTTTSVADELKNVDDEKAKLEKNTKELEVEVNVNDILNTSIANVDDDEKKKNEKVIDGSPAPVNNTKDFSSSSSEPFTLVFARYLLEQGNISNLDEEALQEVIKKDGEQSALSFLIQNEVDYNKEAILENYDAYSQEYIKLREAGVDPQEAAVNLQTLEQLDSISEEDLVADDNETLRKQILTAHYKSTTNFTDDRIKKLVQRSLDLGEDVEDVKEALTSLKDLKRKDLETLKTKKANDKINEEKTIKETIDNLKQKINSLDEIIPDLKLSKQNKTKIEELLTKPVKQTEQGQLLNGVWAKRMENPIEFDIKLAHLIDLGAFDGKWDKLLKKTESKITEELKSKMNAGNSFFGTNKPTISSQKNGESNNLNDLVRALNL